MTWTPEELAELPPERLVAMLHSAEISPNQARRAMFPKTSPDPANIPSDSGLRQSADIEFKIARLDLRPGDVLVLKLPGRVPDEARTRWREDLLRMSGAHKCLILENGADLAVLTAAEIATRTAAPPQSEDMP